MADINYRCPECGGKLELVNIEHDEQLRECAGCIAIYEPYDRALLPFAFPEPSM